MVPTFILPTGYTPRTMRLVLSRSGSRHWRFYGECDGYSVPARLGIDAHGAWALAAFATKADAAEHAKRHSFPAYAMWNGRKRCYEGEAFTTTAYPRGYVAPSAYDFDCGALFDGSRWLEPLTDAARDWCATGDGLCFSDQDGTYRVHPSAFDDVFDAISAAGLTVGKDGGQLVHAA